MAVCGGQSDTVLSQVDENRCRVWTLLSNRTCSRQDLAQAASKVAAVKGSGRRHHFLLAAEQQLNRGERASAAIESLCEALPVQVELTASRICIPREALIDLCDRHLKGPDMSD